MTAPTPPRPPARDHAGYGRRTPAIRWPGGARLAMSVVVNYEEGAEASPSDGDPRAESRTEFPHQPLEGVRDLGTESLYEYGSRVGVWRLLDLLDEFGITATFFACGQALERNPAVARAIGDSNHEACSHGYRWREPAQLTPEQEAEDIRLAVQAFEHTVGRRPVGWYSRWGPSLATRQLLVEEGGFLYDSNAYNDDTPYFAEVDGKDFVVVPYSMDANDMRFWVTGLATAGQFEEYLADTFDVLYREGATRTRLMSVGLHPRIIGRPGRIASLRRFLERAAAHEGVWFARRDEIAQHWLATAKEGNR